MNQLLTDNEIEAICQTTYDSGFLEESSELSYCCAIEAAVLAKIDTSSLSHYLEKSIMDDRKEWRALIGEPVAWFVNKKGSEHLVMFLHYPVDAMADPDRNVVPLYRLPEGMQ